MANKIQEKYKKVMDEYQRVEFKLSPWHKPTPVNLPNNLNSGNPCQYKGVSMMQAHAGTDISTTEFNALVSDLVAALDFYSVPETEKNELLAVLGPLQSQIVGQ